MISNLEAFVLHKQWQGDTSARVCFFTRELGLIHCSYKGGRTPKKQALLQAFQPLWLSLNERHNQHYVQALEHRGQAISLLEQGLIAGLYINELLYYSLSPLQAEPNLFDAYLLTLRQVAGIKAQEALERQLRRFEWGLLSTTGYAFSFITEARSKAPIEAQLQYCLIPGEGFIKVPQGILGSHLLALGTDDLTEASTLYVAKQIMRQAIDHLLEGREIKTRSLYTNHNSPRHPEQSEGSPESITELK